MSFSVGIVGLPNAGKSTLFNALASKRLSATAAHPFTTIDPHEASVPVPDDYLVKLSQLIKLPNSVPGMTATFADFKIYSDSHMDFFPKPSMFGNA